MAGLDQSTAPMPQNIHPQNAQETPQNAQETPSLPLYAAGAVITLCGILAANAALTEPDYGWMTDTIMLAGLGFLFSYGSRQFGIAARTLDYGFAALAVLLLAAIVTRQLSPEQLLPLGADRPDLRLLSGLVWGGTAWSWALRSDNRVMATAVPTMAVLGMAATIDVNTPVLVCFGAFILTVIFLLIHQNYLQNRTRAAGQAAETHTGRLLIAQFFQAGLCGLVVLLAGMLVIVPAQAVFSHLSLSQAIRHLAAIQPDPIARGETRRFSDDDNLAIGTGDAWSSSPDIVMRVSPSDGQAHYWRGRTYDVYTGDGWQSSLENNRANVTVGSAASDDRLSYAVPPGLTPGDPAHPVGRPSLTATFEVLGETDQFYYADAPSQILFNPATARDAYGTQLCRDGRLGLADAGSVRFPYQVVSLLPPDLSQPGAAERLRQAGTAYPADVRDLYLTQSSSAQPDDLAFYRQCIADALQALPPGRHDPLDEASALRDWVSRRCVYTLTPPPLPEDADHVHAFLGDTKRGYCDMFASSLAVLCRAAGIPARLAVGFAPGDPNGSSFNLRAEDKHAWTEVYFPGSGWVAFDATAGSATDGTVPTASSGSKSSWLSRLHFGLSGDWGLVCPLVGLILAIAGYVAKTELYDPWCLHRHAKNAPSGPARQKPRRELAQPYARLTQALARLGLPRQAEETPNEYAARILPLLPPLEREWNVALPSRLVSTLTAAFTLACYSDPAMPTLPAQPWNGPVSEFEAAARRISRRRFWRRVARFQWRPESKVLTGTGSAGLLVNESRAATTNSLP